MCALRSTSLRPLLASVGEQQPLGPWPHELHDKKHGAASARDERRAWVPQALDAWRRHYATALGPALLSFELRQGPGLAGAREPGASRPSGEDDFLHVNVN